MTQPTPEDPTPTPAPARPVIPPDVPWRRPRGVSEGQPCVETAALPDGTVAVRKSDDPDGVVVIYTRAEIDAFVKGVKAGEFDDLIV